MILKQKYSLPRSFLKVRGNISINWSEEQNKCFSRSDSKRDFSSLYEIAPLNYSRGVINLETGINYKINDRFKINMGYGLRETENGMLKLGFETQF